MVEDSAYDSRNRNGNRVAAIGYSGLRIVCAFGA